MYTYGIFDLDGTLADTIGDIAASMDGALKARGFPLPAPDRYPAMVGWGIRRLAFNALPEGARDDAVVDAVAADALERYRRNPVVLTRPYPGIPELLAELRRRGLVLAVYTNKPDPVARLVVDALFPARTFALVRGDVEGRPRKPEPAAGREVLEALGSPAASAFFLGDTAVDVEAGHAAGCPVVGAAWGFRGRDELAAAGADRIIDRAEELLQFLDSR